MTLYRVQIGKNEYKVEISENQVAVNGKPETSSLIPLNEIGLYLLRRGQQSREMHVQAQGPTTYEVMSGLRRVIAKVMKDNGQARSAGQAVQAGHLQSPMPGLIIEVRVSAGQQVSEGQVLVVLESMKMQMELRAPIAGTVAQVNVKAKDQVEKGKVLVKIDPEAGEDA